MFLPVISWVTKFFIEPYMASVRFAITGFDLKYISKMKNGIVFIILIFLATSCSKDEDNGFTSLIGSWTYTTPDSKIKVTFVIVGGTSGTSDILEVQNQTIEVDGQEGNAEIQAEGITEKTFGKIRINANDASLTYPFDITFNDLSASDDFSVINVTDATYIWPWPDNNTLSNIQIVRK